MVLGQTVEFRCTSHTGNPAVKPGGRTDPSLPVHVLEPGGSPDHLHCLPGGMLQGAGPSPRRIPRHVPDRQLPGHAPYPDRTGDEDDRTEQQVARSARGANKTVRRPARGARSGSQAPRLASSGADRRGSRPPSVRVEPNPDLQGHSLHDGVGDLRRARFLGL